MEIFRKIQKILAAMGFTRNQQPTSHGKLNFRQAVFVAVCAINIILLVFYIFFVTKTIDENMDAIFSLTVLVGIMIAFVSLIFKNDDLFTDIECCGETLSESMCKLLKCSVHF